MSKVDKAIKQLNKKYGENYTSYGDEEKFDMSNKISFGVFELDLKTGGGIPDKRVVTLAGRSSSGKTTIALCSIAECQKREGKVLLVDTENSYDKNWARKLGVNFNDLIVSQPDTIEEVINTIETFIITGEIDLIVYDSVPATTTKKELKGSGEDKSMGGKAKEVGLLMRKIKARQKHVNTPILIVNQLREKVAGFGSSSYMPGGNQFKHQSDIVIFMRQGEWLGKTRSPKGIEIKFRVRKSKVSPPLKSGSFELLFKGKINNEKSLIKEATKKGIVTNNGAWYFYEDGDSKVQGMDNFVESLSKEELKEIRQKVFNKLKE